MSDHVLARALAELRHANTLSSDAIAVAAAALVASDHLDETIHAVPGAPAPELNTDTATATAEAGRIYLNRISVTGFRGIGANVELSLTPAPGLVLVTGRNGSGKSSIAEAAELTLSRASRRAESPLWQEGLTNLHHGAPAHIELGLHLDGVGDVTVECDLTEADLRTALFSAHRGTDTYDLNDQGWDDAVVRYRPVLTYSELSALSSAKRSELFDPINKIVGLDGLSAADKLLTSAATKQNAIGKDANSRRTTLLYALSSSDDPRAAELTAALSGAAPNIDAARAVLTGTAVSASGPRKALTALSTLAAPDVSDAAVAVEQLKAAMARDRAASAGAVGRAKRLADMLDLAIAHREHDGDPCPICGVGRLDDAWLASAHRQAAEARAQAHEAQEAAAALRTARTAARKFLTPVPSALTEGVVAEIDTSTARAAWAALYGLDDSTATDIDRDQALVDGLVPSVERLHAAATDLGTAATAKLQEQDSAWEPLAEQAATTVATLGEAMTAKTRAKAVSDARAWLRNLTDQLRQELVRRFADAATGIWAGLRQDSNVALEGITLTGANTRREVHLDLTVDGTPGPQAVLSQGELTALGLALFLPRSTANDSPFRFVLIDDPVQSLDPSKVDGLARVLHRLATDRQLIVFTHDDRLLKTLQRLSLPVTAFMITRAAQSVVTISRALDPVDQYLNDADALARETDLPMDLLAVAVSGYCRDAVDEAAMAMARRRLLVNGESAADADDRIAKVRGTRRMLALALLGDTGKIGQPLAKALTTISADAPAVVTACVEGVHEPNASDVRDLLTRTRALVEELRVR